MAYITIAPRCIICQRPVITQRGHMCGDCAEAYDKFNRRDSTTLGLIRWAAGRALRLERRRVKGKEK